MQRTVAGKGLIVRWGAPGRALSPESEMHLN